MASVFDEILAKGVRAGKIPGRNVDAREWFRDVASQISSGRVTESKILSLGMRKVNSPEVGKMYHFRYDPKFKATLPYYDKFPLIFMVGPAAGGFYGINLHYLPPMFRAKLMDKLYTLATDRRYDANTRVALSYNLLSKASRFKYFKPTFKHYLAMHVQSQFVEIASSEWDIALMLPTQRFVKASADQVYADSKTMF